MQHICVESGELSLSWKGRDTKGPRLIVMEPVVLAFHPVSHLPVCSWCVNGASMVRLQTVIPISLPQIPITVVEQSHGGVIHNDCMLQSF